MESMKKIGIKDRKSYRQTLSDLEEWGFIKKMAKSRNQYQANQIALLIRQEDEGTWNINDDSNERSIW
jgi:hypothetical protein